MLSPSRSALNRLGAVFAAWLALDAVVVAEDRFQVPVRGEVVAAGSFVDVRWTGRSEAIEQELVLSLDGGLTFPIRLSPEMSPRITSMRWSVPDVASAHARLALRSGSGEGSPEETLRLVSDEFTIVASGAGDADDLLRGATEWWTRQALFSPLAEDRLGEEMGRTVQVVLPEDWLEVGEPDSAGPPAASLLSARLVPSRRARSTITTGALAPRIAAPLPLRL